MLVIFVLYIYLYSRFNRNITTVPFHGINECKKKYLVLNVFSLNAKKALSKVFLNDFILYYYYLIIVMIYIYYKTVNQISFSLSILFSTNSYE